MVKGKIYGVLEIDRIKDLKELFKCIYREIPYNKHCINSRKEITILARMYLKDNKMFKNDIKYIKVENGVLYFNDKIVGRICEKDIKEFNMGAYHMESKILARQEKYFD